MQTSHDPAEAADAVAKNVIFLLPDGFGNAQATGYRYFKEDGSAPVWDDGPRALVETHSASSPITDSAASATAYATVVKTDNGAVGVGEDGTPVESVLDLASAAGKATGIVSTAQITDASPAAFAASNVDRDNHDEIAQEYIDNGDLDVILGGGRAAFAVDADGDGTTTIDEALEAGFEYVTTADELAAAGGDRLLGLFNDGEMSGPFGGDEVGDRPGAEPSLAAMTQAALDRLSADEDGFFLFIEEEGTDTLGHANDASATMHSAKAFEDAYRLALDYAEENPDTLVVSVADHETGGMTLEFGEERTPEVFRSFEATYEDMAVAIGEAVADLGEDAEASAIAAAVNDTLADLTGGTLALELDEIATVLGAGSPEASYTELAEILNARGGIEYSTGGHTAVDVPLYAFGAGAHLRCGVLDNTDVAGWMAEAMGLDMPEAQASDEPECPLPAELDEACQALVLAEADLLA
jgi:alkaline phosphatase